MLHIREETAFFWDMREALPLRTFMMVNIQKNYGKIHHAMKMGKSTISTGPCSIISYVNVYQGVNHLPEAIPFFAPPPWLSPCDALSSTLGHARDPQRPWRERWWPRCPQFLVGSINGATHGYPQMDG